MMGSLDNIISPVKEFLRKFSFEISRTAKVARLKQDLKIVDLKRREVLNRLGEKVFDLKKREAIQDMSIIDNLSEQFEELTELEEQAEKILGEIQDVTLMEDDQPDSVEMSDLDIETDTEIKTDPGDDRGDKFTE